MMEAAMTGSSKSMPADREALPNGGTRRYREERMAMLRGSHALRRHFWEEHAYVDL